jgi:hypothetical protein
MLVVVVPHYHEVLRPRATEAFLFDGLRRSRLAHLGRISNRD